MGRLRGFTLIELLVVIAIIGLLASIVLTSLDTARAKARDARRFADLHELQIAVEMYRNDHRTYPYVDCYPEGANIDGWASTYPGTDYEMQACQDELETMLAPYMRQLSSDPLSTGSAQLGHHYWYGSVNDGRGYLLLAMPELSRERGDRCYYPDYWYCIGANWE